MVTTTASTATSAVASSTATNDVQAAVFAFFQSKTQVSLYLVIPLIGLLYTSACISYAVSRCRRKKVRAARRRRRMSGDVEFVNAQAVRHGSESSLKSLLSKDRNRVAPDTSSMQRQNSRPIPVSEKERQGQALDFVASNNSINARDRQPIGAAKLSVTAGSRESGEGRRSTRFSDPSILAAIKEEPTASGRGTAFETSSRDSRRSSYPNHSTDIRPAVHRFKSLDAPGSTLASGQRAAVADARNKSIPLQEHVEEALQKLRVNSNVDTPTGKDKDLRQAMKTAITLEMEVKHDPRAQELIAKYRETKQKSRQTTINESLKKGEWQKVPISEWIALKRAANDIEARPDSSAPADGPRY